MSNCFQVDHEDWWFKYKSFQNQFKDLLYAWQRDRVDLLIRVKSLFAEAITAFEAEQKKKVNQMKQLQICEELHERVRNY